MLLLLVMTFDHFLGVGQAQRIEIADGDHAGGVLSENAGHVHVAADAATADLQDVDLVARGVGTEHAGRNDGGESDGGTGETGQADEITTGGQRGWDHEFC